MILMLSNFAGVTLEWCASFGNPNTIDEWLTYLHTTHPQVTDPPTVKPLPQIEEKIVEVVQEFFLGFKAFPKT